MDTIFIDTQDKKNKSILVISDDLIYMDKLKKEVSLTFDFTFFENNKFYLLNSVINNFDVIIFDNSNNDLKKFLDVFKLTKSYNFNIPVLLIENDKLEDLSIYKMINVYSIIKKHEFKINARKIMLKRNSPNLNQNNNQSNNNIAGVALRT